jgi:hypothetical protein
MAKSSTRVKKTLRKNNVRRTNKLNTLTKKKFAGLVKSEIKPYPKNLHSNQAQA